MHDVFLVAAASVASAVSAAYSQDEWNTFAHSLDFSRLTVSDLMRPAYEMVGLRRDLPLRDNMQVVARHRFSRYPLFEDASGERVAGMIHLKDLLLARQAGSVLEDLSPYTRPVQYVQPNMPALELFRRFRKGAPHLALVGHKGEKPIGFLTLDNLLGALVGQIHDEFRQGDADWTRMDDGTLMGKGSLPVVSLERALGIDIDEEVELGGEDSGCGRVVLWVVGRHEPCELRPVEGSSLEPCLVLHEDVRVVHPDVCHDKLLFPLSAPRRSRWLRLTRRRGRREDQALRGPSC